MPSEWRCPRCGRRFASRNQGHSCVATTATEFVARQPAPLVGLYESLLARARAHGPVEVIPRETKLSLKANADFAGITFRRDALLVELLLPRSVENPRLQHLEPRSPTSFAHLVRLTRPQDLDAELDEWLAQAYAVGASTTS